MRNARVLHVGCRLANFFPLNWGLASQTQTETSPDSQDFTVEATGRRGEYASTNSNSRPSALHEQTPTTPVSKFPHGSATARVRRLSERRERGERVEAVDERLRRLSRSKSWMIKVEAWAPPIRTDARGQGHSTRAQRAAGREPASQRGRSGGRCMREAAQGRRSDDTSRRTAPSKPPVG